MTASRLDNAFRLFSFLLMFFLAIVLALGADQLFGQLISRGFLPHSLSFSGFAAPLLNLTHLAIYAGIGLGLANMSHRGVRSWRSGLAVGVPFLLQVVTNGCILTVAQNYFWGLEGIAPISNEFIFDAFVPFPAAVNRILILAVSLLYLVPAALALRTRLASNWNESGAPGVSAGRETLPTLTLSGD